MLLQERQQKGHETLLLSLVLLCLYPLGLLTHSLTHSLIHSFEMADGGADGKAISEAASSILLEATDGFGFAVWSIIQSPMLVVASKKASFFMCVLVCGGKK